MAKVDRSRPKGRFFKGYFDKESHVKQVVCEPSDQPQAYWMFGKTNQGKMGILGQVD